jgi:hypothetical protein
VSARDAFADSPTASRGIAYSVAVSSAADADEVERLMTHIGKTAEIPHSPGHSTSVTRESPAGSTPRPGRSVGSRERGRMALSPKKEPA